MGRKKEPEYITIMHEFAEVCDYAHAKCSYLDVFISNKANPVTKDSNGLTARQVAEKKYKTAETEWGNRHCKWVMEQLELYAEWYREQNQSADESSNASITSI